MVDSNAWLERRGTVGRPFVPDQIKVGDEAGEPLPPGEVGLVYLKVRPGRRFSYFKDDEKTRSTYRGNYFTLGDMGYQDQDGYLFLTDRSADLIISGGVNIYPAEVDGVLLEHPAVADAGTIGIPDPEWGERVLAVVELSPDHTPSEALAEKLIEHCRIRLAHYKCPREVEFVDTLPRLDNGKVYKRVLRDRYRASAAKSAGDATSKSTPS
ncbi:MAG: AMP-binding protein [Proteobacteria bacterium]|nr:AMP-binding protein [Pseudomonadota bacterium]